MLRFGALTPISFRLVASLWVYPDAPAVGYNRMIAVVVCRPSDDRPNRPFTSMTYLAQRRSGISRG